MVIVMNRPNAKKYSYQPHKEKSIIISITDPEAPYNNFNRDHDNGIIAVLPIKFADVNRGDINCITKEQANKIATFVKRYIEQVDVVLVHCEAGQSRSAGCAAAILKWSTGSDSLIYDNPRYTPNSTVYSYILEALFMEEE